MRGPKIKLNAARVNAGLTQTEVARKLNRNKQTIVNWEKGFTEIKVNDLLALSELYGIPIEYLEIPQRRKEDS
jgi:transcriptional regulator with XRE-family HTH domain